MDYRVLFGKQTIYNEKEQEEMIDLLNLTYIEPIDYDYSVFKVTKEYIARPDLISNAHFGSPNYADLICKLNGISNPFELNEGMLLILPTPGHVDLFYYSGDEIDHQTLNTFAPKVKSPNEKRAVNEAVAGDSRYRIDRSRGIIIY